jgi:hypothetical protein
MGMHEKMIFWVRRKIDVLDVDNCEREKMMCS